jgi:hypothetical protein
MRRFDRAALDFDAVLQSYRLSVSLFRPKLRFGLNQTPRIKLAERNLLCYAPGKGTIAYIAGAVIGDCNRSARDALYGVRR